MVSLSSVSVKAVYNELHSSLMAIDEQEDLRWWRHTQGPGMPTDWPQFQVHTHTTHKIGRASCRERVSSPV